MRMSIYNNNDLRREILKTLNIVPFCEFNSKAVLRALRESGFGGLSSGDLSVQASYLAKKGYIEIRETENFISKEKTSVFAISDKGIDLLEGNHPDVGVSDG